MSSSSSRRICSAGMLLSESAWQLLFNPPPASPLWLTDLRTDPTQELRDPPSPASLMRMASVDDALWDRDQIGSDLGHSGPSETRQRPSRLGHRSSPTGWPGGEADGSRGDDGVRNGDVVSPGARTRLRARREDEQELVRAAHLSEVVVHRP